ncbi:MAG: sugar transferase [Nanoarchaeota archaeon]
MSFFHRRTVLGKKKVPFVQYKIRTMHEGSENNRKDLADLTGLDGLGKPRNDPRITPIGIHLRKYGLDELPQLYNLLRGDMTFVGIRPHTESEWASFSEDHRKNALEYKPGLFPAALAEGIPDTIDRLILSEQKYLASKKERPFKTDAIYLAKLFYQFIWKGLRSR